VELRGLAVVDVPRERAEGGIGGRFFGKFFRTVARDGLGYNPCFILSIVLRAVAIL
jgi:hypothetical protein